ncbi:MAG: transporter, partial [Comamonadaceae bacterium 32-67-11]
MEMSDIQAQTTLVLWAAFAVAFLFGAVAQRTHFCTMGAISDAVNMGDWTRLRMWGMAAGIAMLGFYGMAALGWIDPLQTIHSGSRVRWLSALLGGALFGFGMVLASGCGSKTLVRIGAGNLKSLVVFFVMGLAAYATLSGVTAVLRNQTID